MLRVVGRRLLPGVSILPRLLALRDLKAARVLRQRKPGAADFLVVSLRSGWLTPAVPFARAAQRFLEQQPRGMGLVMTSGIFWPERILWELAQRAGYRDAVLYERGFIRGTWVFARNQVPAYYDLSQHWAKYRDRPVM